MLQPKKWLRDAWDNCFDSNSASDKAFESVVGKYRLNRLAYHNLGHIAQCLELWFLSFHLAANPMSVVAAIWYHDVIYDSKRNDNEEQSAEYALRELVHLTSDGKPVDCALVKDLILATKHNKPADGPDAQLIIDIDLQILGSNETRYTRYTREIRKEYAWVPEADFRAGRSKVLTMFLEKRYIYNTRLYRSTFEEQARENISREIEMLRAR